MSSFWQSNLSLRAQCDYLVRRFGNSTANSHRSTTDFIWLPEGSRYWTPIHLVSDPAKRCSRRLFCLRRRIREAPRSRGTKRPKPLNLGDAFSMICQVSLWNLTDKGNRQTVVMAISGHKTGVVFPCYNISHPEHATIKGREQRAKAAQEKVAQ